MKKYLVLPLISLLAFSVTGCKKKSRNEEQQKWEVYHEDYVYDTPTYEPIDFTRNGTYPYTIAVEGIPEKGILQTRWDDHDIKLRCHYLDGALVDFAFKEKNIPIEFRHYLGEVGHHKLDIEYGLMPVSVEFDITLNTDWKGFNCYFFDSNNKLIHSQSVGYYATVNYNGPEISELEEDEDYQYNFVGWNNDTKNINEDMQFKTVYEKNEKRLYAIKPYQLGYQSISTLVDNDKNKASSLFYLGRVRRVAAVYTEPVKLTDKDIELKFDYSDFGSYWNDLNKSIIGTIKYEHDSTYDSMLYGSVPNLLENASYGTIMDNRYDFKGGTKTYLENEEEITMSAIDPYVFLANRVQSFTGKTETVKARDNVAGYYRQAVVFNFDVYLSASYRRIGSKIYELGDFSQFICCPVINTAKCVVQYSADGKFGDNFSTYLSLTDKALYNNASSQNWKPW